MFIIVYKANANEVFVHGTAGFSVEQTSQPTITTTIDALDISKGSSLISVENLNINSGETSEILSLFAPNSQGETISKPYPGLRSSIQEDGYAAEVVVLKTPVGFYLLSLEQDRPDQANLDAFEAILNSFTLLDTPPVSHLIDQLQPVILGPVDLSLPEGELTVEQESLFWKSDAAGFLTAEIVKKGDGPLSQSIEIWEKAMLNADTGLSTRTSMLELTVEDRPAVQADYSGYTMQARVQVSALDKNNLLVLALIARKETFATHQPVLDAVSFSVVSADDSSNAIAAQPTQSVQYNEIVEAVSDQFLLDAGAVNRLYKQKPALFKNIKATVKKINSLDTMFSTSVEALAGKTSWKDQSSQPDDLRRLYSSLRSYKVSMAMLPKEFQTRALPEEALRRYTEARSRQSAILACSTILEDTALLKERDNVHSQLLAEKKTGDAVTEEMTKYLKGKADLYWRNRLEANYQLSRASSNREAIVKALWQQRQSDAKLISDALR